MGVHAMANLDELALDDIGDQLAPHGHAKTEKGDQLVLILFKTPHHVPVCTLPASISASLGFGSRFGCATSLGLAGGIGKSLFSRRGS
jgi:hypothetical protein